MASRSFSELFLQLGAVGDHRKPWQRRSWEYQRVWESEAGRRVGSWRGGSPRRPAGARWWMGGGERFNSTNCDRLRQLLSKKLYPRLPKLVLPFDYLY
jgi:hypothetical protein